jgi:predicted O-methyltransferase YrrM
VAAESWTAVDEYLTGLLTPDDEALEAALRASEQAGLPEIQVSPPQGKLLYLLAKALEAKAILEFGTLGGYSTIWLARALVEGGRLITLEAEPRYAEVAGENIARAGLSDLVDLRIGPAWICCRPWKKSKPVRSISLSSTPTRFTALTTSPGPSRIPIPAA